MHNKICLVTGANSGIGEITARELARKGAHVVMVCRSERKARAAMTRIERALPYPRLELLVGDLSSMESVRGVAEVFRSQHQRLDVCVNNAGIYMPHPRQSVDGLEMTFATNHLGPYLLTNLLLEPLRAAAGARVIHSYPLKDIALATLIFAN